MKRIFLYLALFSAPVALLPSVSHGKLSNEQCALTNTGDRYSPEWQDMLLSFQSGDAPKVKRRSKRKQTSGKGSSGLE